MGKLDISRFSNTNQYSCPDPAEIIARTAIRPTEIDKKRLEKAESNSRSEQQGTPLEQSYNNVWGSSQEKVECISLLNLSHYTDEEGHSQPFNLNEDKIAQIMTSAADVGIITPLIVRKSEGIRFQIIAGHHRYEAAKRLNLLTVPCIVRNITDEEAFQIVTESNIQRDKTLPCEYGRIFTAYMEKRSDVDMTAQEIADKFGVSKKNMYRYINAVKLVPELHTYVDSGRIQLSAVETILKFSEANQITVADVLQSSAQKKITPAIAKQFAEVVENYNGDDVPMHEFSRFLYFTQTKQQKYKSSVYNNISARFNINKTEDELNELAERLLTEYFEKEN